MAAAHETADRDVRNARFAEWATQALQRARDQGLTDKDITERTGVPPQTFHRWQSGRLGVQGPRPDNVYAFCDGLGLPRDIPATIYGWRPDAVATTPTPPTPAPDGLDGLPIELRRIVRTLLHRLRDPSVDVDEKIFIEKTLTSLAARRRPRKRVTEADANATPADDLQGR